MAESTGRAIIFLTGNHAHKPCAQCGRRIGDHTWGNYSIIKEILSDRAVLLGLQPRTFGNEACARQAGLSQID